MAAHVQIKFLRKNALPAGTRFHILWNGRTSARNHDGLPPEDIDDSVDEDNPLTPGPIPVWPFGKAGFGGEPFGAHPFGHPSNPPPYGFGRKPFGAGEFGYHNDYVIWNTSLVLPAVRDGTYKFAVRFESPEGTIQTDDLEVASIELAGVPRPPTRLQFGGYSGGNLTLNWVNSPDEVST